MENDYFIRTTYLISIFMWTVQCDIIVFPQFVRLSLKHPLVKWLQLNKEYKDQETHVMIPWKAIK